MTNEQLAQLIATLISDFIRPNAQQHLESMARLDRIEQLLERQAEVITGIDVRLDSATALLQETIQQQQSNAQQIAQNAEAITRYDARLEETRQLVAKNSSDMARRSQETDRQIAELSAAGDEQQTKIDQMIGENQAFRESQQTQLAAIIGNARRIDRLEQQAS